MALFNDTIKREIYIDEK